MSLIRPIRVRSSAPVSVIPDPNAPYTHSVIFEPSKHKLPEYIKRHNFHSPHSGRNIAFYTSEAENEKAIVIGGSGLKHDFPLPFDQVKKLNDAGYSYLWIGLPNPIRNDKFVEHYVHIAEELLTNPRNEIMQKWLAKDKPKLFLGYSTSAQLFFHLLRNNRTFETLTNDFTGAVAISPYLRPPKLETDNCLRARILRNAAKKHPQCVSVETRMGAGYYLAGKEDGIDVPNWLQILSHTPLRLDPRLAEGMEFTTPTLQQMVELMDHGTPILHDSFNENSNLINRNGLPILIMTGSQDSYAGAQINREFSERTNMSLYECPDAKHALMYEDPQAIQVLISAYDSMLKGTFDKMAQALGEWDQEKLLAQRTSFLKSIKLPQMPHLGGRRTQPESAHTPS
jgi:pimeloyl-ACP methyl ester carboxylesterase